MNSSWRASHAVCFYIPEKLEPTTCFATLVSTPFLNNLQICNNLQISLCGTSQEILFYLENLPVIPTLCFLPFNHKRIKLFSYLLFHIISCWKWKSSAGLAQICKGWLPGHACSTYMGGPFLTLCLGVLLWCSWKQNQTVSWKCNRRYLL